MKRLLVFIVAMFVIISAIILKYRLDNEKYHDINYSASHYITTGLFNKHKLYKINDLKLSFSDGNMAIVTISGLLYKAPHDVVKYNILLEKNVNGIWKVSRVYD